MIFVKNHISYLWDLSNSFSNSFIDFYSCEGFHQVIYQEEWSIKLRVVNGGWHESLNLLHVSRCEMLHFVTSYTKQNKSRKQTLESAQYGLEISFNCDYNCDDHISISSVGSRSSVLSRIKMNSKNCSAPNTWFFIARLAEHCSANAGYRWRAGIFWGIKFATD